MGQKIYYQGGFKFQLYYDYLGNIGRGIPKDIAHPWFDIKRNGDIKIKKGYAWDGPSGPGIDTKNFMRGSLIHDVLYQCIRLGLLPESFRFDADEIIRETCLEAGMSRIRATWVYYGLRLGAGWAADKKNKRKIMSAP